MGIIVGVNLLDQDGKACFETDVPPYPIGISCKGVYYYRSGSARQILTGPALEVFLMRKRCAAWDNLPFPAFEMEDVDDNVIARFKKLAAKKWRIDTSFLAETKEVGYSSFLLTERLHASLPSGTTPGFPFASSLAPSVTLSRLSSHGCNYHGKSGRILLS